MRVVIVWIIYVDMHVDSLAFEPESGCRQYYCTDINIVSERPLQVLLHVVRPAAVCTKLLVARRKHSKKTRAFPSCSDTLIVYISNVLRNSGLDGLYPHPPYHHPQLI